MLNYETDYPQNDIDLPPSTIYTKSKQLTKWGVLRCETLRLRYI
jgi:hypothetical protein